MKKIAVTFILVLAALAAVVYFFLTADREVVPKGESEIRRISIYHYLSGELQGGMAGMIDTINGRHPEIRVMAQALDHEAFKSMIHKSLAGGTPPELFTHWAGAKTQELVDQGKLEPIDDIWQAAALNDRFSPAVAEAASTYNGKKYLLPIGQHVAVFFYNSKVFARAGLKPPADWRELLDVAGKLQADGITPFALGARERWPAQFWFDYLLLRTAGPEYRARLVQNKASYADAEVRKVYAMWADLLQKGYFNQNANDLDWAEAARLVCTGEAAATLMGTWAIQLLTGSECNLAEGEGFDFFAFPIIDPGVPRVVVGPVDGIVLTRESVNRDSARKIMPFFAERESQQIMSSGSGGFAPSRQVGRDTYSLLRQRILAEVDRSPHWAFNYDLATPFAIADKGLSSFSELIEFPAQHEEILANLVQEIAGLANRPTQAQ